jgi:hypothetical protein
MFVMKSLVLYLAEVVVVMMMKQQLEADVKVHLLID